MVNTTGNIKTEIDNIMMRQCSEEKKEGIEMRLKDEDAHGMGEEQQNTLTESKRGGKSGSGVKR